MFAGSGEIAKHQLFSCINAPGLPNVQKKPRKQDGIAEFSRYFKLFWVQIKRYAYRAGLGCERKAAASDFSSHMLNTSVEMNIPDSRTVGVARFEICINLPALLRLHRNQI